MYMSTLAPSIVRETDMVMIMAMVIVTLRHRPTSTSLRTYLKRIGGSFRDSAAYISCSVGAGARLAAGNDSGLVADDPSAFDLDDPAAHLVDDVGVVGDHHDRRAGPVDPADQPHDLDGGVRGKVAGGLVGQQDQGPVHERPGHRDTLCLATGQCVRVA